MIINAYTYTCNNNGKVLVNYISRLRVLLAILFGTYRYATPVYAYQPNYYIHMIMYSD